MKQLKIVITLTKNSNPDPQQPVNRALTTNTRVPQNNVWHDRPHVMHLTAMQPAQSGAVLIISLIMLLLLTIIGMTGSQVTAMEEKMAGNSRNHNLAFQAAESALRVAEGATGSLIASNYYTRTSQSTPIDWSNNKVTSYAGGTLAGIQTANAPKYIVESLGNTEGSQEDCTICEGGVAGTSKGVSWYRITARGMGGNANSVVLLQSIYKRE